MSRSLAIAVGAMSLVTLTGCAVVAAHTERLVRGEPTGYKETACVERPFDAYSRFMQKTGAAVAGHEVSEEGCPKGQIKLLTPYWED